MDYPLNHHKIFTPEEDQQIIDARREHWPYQDIAKRLGRSHSSISQRVFALRQAGKLPEVPSYQPPVAPPPTNKSQRWSNKEDAALLIMERSGMMHRDIAEVLQRTLASVHARVSNLRLAARAESIAA